MCSLFLLRRTKIRRTGNTNESSPIITKTLKTLGKLAGVDKPLSSYVARHTWATLAFMSSVDMSVIAQALGHTDVKTTRIYVEDIGNGKQNSANKKLLDESDSCLYKRSPLYKRYNNFQYVEYQQLPHVSLLEKAWNRYFSLEKKAVLFCLFYLICISSQPL
ncbi:MAG: tyrosine-type recombinase/integrase [Bacteroides stercoris]